MKHVPNSLEEYFMSPAALPIWQNAFDGNYNERTITAPKEIKCQYPNAHMANNGMGITYKSIPWK